MSENKMTDQEIGDKLYIETMNHIKKCANEFLDKEELKFEVWQAMKDGVKEFLEEYYKDFIEKIAEEMAEKIEMTDFEINFTSKRK